MAFDIEKFPISPSALRMLEYVSPVYDRSYVAKWLYQVMGLELDQVRQIFEELPLQITPDTATWGLRYWEDLYEIPVDETIDLETRREAVLRRRTLRGPLNPARLETMIRTTFGYDAVVTENTAPYTFRVDVEDLTDNWRRFLAWLAQIKPSHLAADVTFLLNPAQTVYAGAGVDLQMYQYIQTDLAVYSEQGIESPALYAGAGAAIQMYQSIETEPAVYALDGMQSPVIHAGAGAAVQMYQYLQVEPAGISSRMTWGDLLTLSWGRFVSETEE